MGIFRRKRKVTRIDLVSENNAGFYTWGNTAYNSDLVRSCVRARANRFCKLELQHIRATSDDSGKTIAVNPEPYIRRMITEPNPYMSMRDLLYKTMTSLDLSGNAFWLILRDGNGLARELYYVPALSAEADYDSKGNLSYVFTLSTGEQWKFPSTDVIHLREDFFDNDIFGASKFQALSPLLEVSETMDRGIINAIKNSNVVRWLLKYTAALRPEALKKNAEEFANNYLAISNGSVGVAAVDAKADATQVNPQDYVPNSAQMSRTRERILSLFNTNEKIITASANEDEENAYYEVQIEPVALALKAELTRKLFSPRERACGNYITVGCFNLQSVSISTKLNLQSMVDRGALTPNEWREALGLPPIPGGNEPLRRLDTQPVEPDPVKGGEE